MMKHPVWVCIYVVIFGISIVPLFPQQYSATRLDGDLHGSIFLADSIVLAYGTNGIVLRSSDLGNTWLQKTGLKERNYVCGAAIGKTVIVFGERNAVLISHDLGATWLELIALGEEFTPTHNCTALNPNQFFLTDRFGRSYLYTVNTNSNTYVEGLRNIEINLIVYVGGTDYMAAGSDGIYQSSDAGNTWVKFQNIAIPSSFSHPVSSAVTKTGKICFFYGSNTNEMIVVYTGDSGKLWQVTKSFKATHSMMISETDCITYNQKDKRVVRIDSIFTSIRTTEMIIDTNYFQVKPDIYGFINVSNSTIFMFGSAKSIYKVNKGSSFVTLVSLLNPEGAYYSLLTTNNHKTLFFAGDGMTFYTSHNNGATWKPRINPTGYRFSVRCNSASIFDSTLFFATSDAKALFRSTDGGTHFDILGLKDSSNIITEFYGAVDIVSPNLIIKTTQQTQLLVIRDTGRTWELRANPIKSIEYVGSDSLVIVRNITQLKYLRDSIIIALLWENKYNRKNGKQENK
ncbi:MAG: hypothetical protein JNJ85_06570, partial [Candidatus Kapabacteria bacterium]|nr:hypothetical protein [Candidatus Kapabacteria bacterium]